jgi:hypothetical protein
MGELPCDGKLLAFDLRFGATLGRGGCNPQGRVADAVPEMTPYGAFGLLGVIPCPVAHGPPQAGLIRGGSSSYTVPNLVIAA